MNGAGLGVRLKFFESTEFIAGVTVKLNYEYSFTLAR
jgi:hypothetical protein